MILSMTGFGKAVHVFETKKISVEIKSLNSKQLDLAVKLPHAYLTCELELRNQMAQKLLRGKVDIYITCEDSRGATPVCVNVGRMQQYKCQIEQISQQLSIPLPTDWYATLLRLPDVMINDSGNDELPADESKALILTAHQALDALIEFRSQEGKRLEHFFEEKVAAIQQLLGEVPQYETSRLERIRCRILDNLNNLDGVDYDNNRLEQELIFYIEKLDITEERIRLQNHINYFIETLHAPEPGQGKKLGFIAQEMGREINTMGSKANHAELQNVVVRMKDQLEQIKEQVLNVL